MDLLTGVGGWSYPEVEADAVQVSYEGLTFGVLSKERVLADRVETVRDPKRGDKVKQDLEDLRHLR